MSRSNKLRVGGYAVVTDPDKGRREYDTLTCSHCQFVIHLRIRKDVEWDFCRMCMKHICGPCATRLLEPVDKGGGCVPFEKKLDAYERSAKLGQAAGLILRVLVLCVLLSTPVWASGLRVTWTDNAGSETEYRLERQLGACGVDRQPWVEIAVLPSNTTSYDDRTLADGEVYCYRVRACDASTCTSYSAVNGGKTNRPPKTGEFNMARVQ